MSNRKKQNTNLRLNDAVHVVYARYCAATDKTYFGSTHDIEARVGQQNRIATQGYENTNPAYYADLAEHEFETTILATVQGKEAALAIERHFTSLHPPERCYNILNTRRRQLPSSHEICDQHRANLTAKGRERLAALRPDVVELYESGVTVNEISQRHSVGKGWIYGVLREARS